MMSLLLNFVVNITYFIVFIGNFEHILHLALVFLFLSTLFLYKNLKNGKVRKKTSKSSWFQSVFPPEYKPPVYNPALPDNIDPLKFPFVHVYAQGVLVMFYGISLQTGLKAERSLKYKDV